MRAWFAPGRVEVFGKHTDYAGGRSLVCAVPRGITIRIDSTDDARVTVTDVGERQSAVFATDGTGPDEGWCRYPQTVIRRLAANFPGAKLSSIVHLSSDLPRAAGISSSSALIVGLAQALIDRSGIEAHERWRENIRTPEDRAGYYGCIENGASFGSLSGHEGVGTHGGSEDHAAIMLSRRGEMRQFSFDPIAVEEVVRMPQGWTFVVLSSGVAARKIGDVQDAYNRLSLRAAAIRDAWRHAHPGDTRSLGRLARAGALRGWMPPAVLRDRFDQFVAEDARVADASYAFNRGDIAAIGSLAEASQAEADRLLGNQIPETRFLVTLAREIGAPAASAFGAGWGGSVWALIKTTDAESYSREWLTAYRLRYAHHPAEGFVAPPSGGVQLLDAIA